MKINTSLLILISILVLLVSPQLVATQTYKWVDQKGVLHFTDDPTRIPEQYRLKVEKSETSVEHQTSSSQAPPMSSKRQDNVYRDTAGRDETYWRGRTEEWKQKLAAAREREQSLRVSYNDLTEKMNASKNAVERAKYRAERDQVRGEIDQQKALIEEAKRMLEKTIPEEAALFKAKSDWVKP